MLPPDQFAHLKEICDTAKNHHVVYDIWGFGGKLSLGKGLNVLFVGPSGTGKTMAADVIANELGIDLYKIDLSQVVSKYIGETEKNISQTFQEAKTSNSILFFDEADALFGKRSEVKDAHDRFANIETSYLLQKMEEHEGIVILASNLRNNMDQAFVRRMTAIVEFPFPDEEHRHRIWRGLFPSGLPSEKALDYGFLARNFKLTGGHIKSIGLRAAFLSAADGREMDMRHVIRAAKREYQKMQKPCTEADFGQYFEWVDE